MAELETYNQEQVYQEIYARFMRMEVPPCTQCDSRTTASVQVGIIGTTIRLAAKCNKFKLIAHGPKPGNWFCNSCHQFFSITDETDKGADVRTGVTLGGLGVLSRASHMGPDRIPFVSPSPSQL
jgi:hypothetical protein